MTEPVDKRPPIEFGVPFDELPKVMDKVIELYGEIAGRPLISYQRYLLTQDRLREGFRRSTHIEYRFGSALTMHSKLWFEIRRRGLIRVRFDSNMEEKIEIISEELKWKNGLDKKWTAICKSQG